MCEPKFKQGDKVQYDGGATTICTGPYIRHALNPGTFYYEVGARNGRVVLASENFIEPPPGCWEPSTEEWRVKAQPLCSGGRVYAPGELEHRIG